MNIKIYGAEWCSDCRVVKSLFDAKGIAYEYISITDNVEAISFVEKINNGKRIIPTMVINGKTYTNPGISKLINIITQ